MRISTDSDAGCARSRLAPAALRTALRAVQGEAGPAGSTSCGASVMGPRSLRSRGPLRRCVSRGRGSFGGTAGNRPARWSATAAATAHASSFASIVICAFSNFDTGHPTLALFAISWNFASSAPGIFRGYAQVARRDLVAGAESFPVLPRHGFDLLRRQPGFAEHQRERHREAAGMRRADQLFRIGALAVLEARLEPVRRSLDPVSVEMVPPPSLMPPFQTAHAFLIMTAP